MSVSLSSRRPTCIPEGLPLLPSPILVETPTSDFITAPQTLLSLYFILPALTYRYAWMQWSLTFIHTDMNAVDDAPSY